MATLLTELSKVFQAGCIDFAQMKAFVELCINKLSDAAAKCELKANREKFDSGLGNLERRMVWLKDVRKGGAGAGLNPPL